MQFLFTDYTLDTDRRELRRGSQPIAVEPQVFDLLGAFSTPYRAQQGAMRHHFAGMAGHVQEQIEFFWSEVDGAIFH